MKKTDYAMIILIAGVSLLISYFVVSSLPFFKDVSEPVKVKSATTIKPGVEPIDEKIFNKKAINPTVETYIGTQKEDGASPEATSPDDANNGEQ